jgi:hypothetical protein
MNSQQKSNKYFKSENHRLNLKDYLILIVFLISNFFLVVLWGSGELDLELIIINSLIIVGAAIVVSTLAAIFISKKMDSL